MFISMGEHTNTPGLRGRLDKCPACFATSDSDEYHIFEYNPLYKTAGAEGEEIMRKLTVFNHVSLDGYFTDANGDMSFARNDKPDAEWDAFVADNASGGGMLVFGRITYQM